MERDAAARAILSNRIHPDLDPSLRDYTAHDLLYHEHLAPRFGSWVIPLRPLLFGALFLFVAWWFVIRFTDGIWPSERRLARHTRERAAEYRRRKKDEDAEQEPLLHVSR